MCPEELDISSESCKVTGKVSYASCPISQTSPLICPGEAMEHLVKLLSA